MELKSLSRERRSGEVLAIKEPLMRSLPEAERALVNGSVIGVILLTED